MNKKKLHSIMHKVWVPIVVLLLLMMATTFFYALELDHRINLQKGDVGFGYLVAVITTFLSVTLVTIISLIVDISRSKNKEPALWKSILLVVLMGVFISFFVNFL